MKDILEECNVSICKAACCGIVPINNSTVRTFKNLINEGSTINRNGSVSVIYNPETFVCGFLDNNCKCKIYDNRPDVCRKYADPVESHPMLKCHYLGQINIKTQNKDMNKIIGELF